MALTKLFLCIFIASLLRDRMLQVRNNRFNKFTYQKHLKNKNK